MGGKVFSPSWEAWQKDTLGTHPCWGSAKIQMRMHFKSHPSSARSKASFFSCSQQLGEEGTALAIPFGSVWRLPNNSC